MYARVSTNEQRKESIGDQLRECRELCRRHGFEVAGEFCDRRALETRPISPVISNSLGPFAVGNATW
jgi:DNA invertase Pin-like site-specific DNA recombinase